MGARRPPSSASGVTPQPCFEVCRLRSFDGTVQAIEQGSLPKPSLGHPIVPAAAANTDPASAFRARSMTCAEKHFGLCKTEDSAIYQDVVSLSWKIMRSIQKICKTSEGDMCGDLLLRLTVRLAVGGGVIQQDHYHVMLAMMQLLPLNVVLAAMVDSEENTCDVPLYPRLLEIEGIQAGGCAFSMFGHWWGLCWRRKLMARSCSTLTWCGFARRIQNNWQGCELQARPAVLHFGAMAGHAGQMRTNAMPSLLPQAVSMSLLQRLVRSQVPFLLYIHFFVLFQTCSLWFVPFVS